MATAGWILRPLLSLSIFFFSFPNESVLRPCFCPPRFLLALAEAVVDVDLVELGAEITDWLSISSFQDPGESLSLGVDVFLELPG